MSSTQVWIIGGVSIYMLGMIGVGLWASRRIKSTTDYIVAGHSLPWWLSAGTIFATWFGAETCMGASGAAYEKGILGIIADPLGAGLCLILSGLFFAPVLHRLKVETITDYFEARYGRRTAVALTLFYIPCYTGWIGAQLIAFGTILNSLTGLPLMPAILVSTFVVLFYTYFGGMWADTIADFFQMLIIIACFLIIGYYVSSHLGGWSAAKARISPESFYFYPRGAGGLEWLNYFQAWIVIGLGSLGGQDLLSRILSAKSPGVARWSSIGAGFMYWTIGLIPVMLGIFGRLIFPEYAGESILIDLTLKFLPPPLVALMVGALLAAIMSSADSAILAPASIIGRNLVGYIKPDISEEAKLKWCKWSVPVLGVASLLLALYFQNIYQLCQEAWGFLLTAVTGPMIFGIFWKRATPAAAFAGSIAGAVSWLGLSFILPPEYPTKLFGFLISCAAIVAVTLSQKEERSVWQAEPQRAS